MFLRGWGLSFAITLNVAVVTLISPICISGQQPLCIGDLDHNGSVDGADLGLLLAAWGSSGRGGEDLDGSGVVNGGDLGLLLSTWGGCVIETGCFGSNHDCCAASTEPHCNDPVCCSLVCELDTYCCDVMWDSLCAIEAEANCPGLECPSPCAVNNPTDCFLRSSNQPGCDDVECCVITCGIDSFCCDQAWDFICAAEAIRLCLSPCELECDGVMEQEQCGQDTNGGCDSSGVMSDEPIQAGQVICGNTYISGSFRDVDWFHLESSGIGNLAQIVVEGTSESPIRIEIRSGDCGEMVHASIGTEHCDIARLVACVAAEDVWIVVSPTAYAVEPCASDNEYHLMVSVNPECTFSSNCCIPNGGPGCDDSACESAVCEVDHFCCAASWDFFCAVEAQELCPELCGG